MKSSHSNPEGIQLNVSSYMHHCNILAQRNKWASESLTSSPVKFFLGFTLEFHVQHYCWQMWSRFPLGYWLARYYWPLLIVLNLYQGRGRLHVDLAHATTIPSQPTRPASKTLMIPLEFTNHGNKIARESQTTSGTCHPSRLFMDSVGRAGEYLAHYICTNNTCTKHGILQTPVYEDTCCILLKHITELSLTELHWWHHMTNNACSWK